MKLQNFKQFITSPKVGDLVVGYMLASAIKELIEHLSDGVLYPLITNRDSLERKLALKRVGKEIIQFFSIVYVTFLIAKHMKLKISA